MAAPLPQLELDRQFCFPLYAAARAVTRQYAELLAAEHLTYPQYLCLLALWEADAPMTVGEVGARLRLDSGTLTPVLKRLEGAGVLARHRDPDDERRVLVQVTEAGWALRARVADVPMRLAARAELAPEDALALRALLDRLLAVLPD